MLASMAKKSYTKRIRMTKSGKLLRRKKGLGHARAKKASKVLRQKRNLTSVSKADRSAIGARLNK